MKIITTMTEKIDKTTFINPIDQSQLITLSHTVIIKLEEYINTVSFSVPEIVRKKLFEIGVNSSNKFLASVM